MLVTDILEIKDIWEEIESQDAITPFSTWSWGYNWLRYWNKAPHVYINEFGIAPFILYRGKLRFIGFNNSDYQGFLIVKGKEREFYAALSEELLKEGVHMVDLENVPEYLSEFQINGFEKKILDQDICPYINLPEDIDHYMAVINKRFRKNIEYYWRRLNRDHNVTYDVVNSEEDIEPAMLRMIEFHQKRWNKKLLPGAFYSQRIIQFHLHVAKDFFKKGYLDLHRLMIDGDVAAVLYCFHKGRSTYYYIGGFNEAYRNMSVGNLLIWLAIGTSIERGDVVFDFLRGGELYKGNFCNMEKMNKRVILYRGGIGRIQAGIIEKENSLVMAIKDRIEA
ncbi:GNAT family N-acetyltransferase [Calorimonas adulescens]|uniref:GNAT family N-acetyltransferase n=1 Tax=Calorimonas adulescens TaxID=2606906 RepID=A0A5D8QCE3_9THEO|nr:GNAT family N-acetyltransferase [Calorimonas adulescens]TZE81466.1 GNAT family N-acetyltransferase [Calorimonas adulescens]